MADLKAKVINISNKIAKEQKFEEDYVLDVKQLSTDGNSYSSAIFRVSITEPNRTLKLFAKVANINEDFRKTSYAKIFVDELYFYNDLAEKFKEIERRHNISEDDRLLIPKLYGGDPSFGEETIVLEDLASKGFASHDQQLPFDWEYASKVVEQLAKFHALSFVYNIEDPAGFSKVLESRPYHIFDTEIMRSVAFDMTVPLALEAVEGENRQRLKQYLETQDRFQEMVELYKQMPKRVIVHGDFKTNNLMHRHHNGRLEVMPIDFQIIHSGSPVTDILYFIFLGSDEEFRRRHYRELLDLYFSQLTVALGRMGVEVDEVYPRTVFEEDLKAALPIGLAVSLMILPMLLVDAADAVTLEEELTPASQPIKPNAKYAPRFNGIVRDYVLWGIL